MSQKAKKNQKEIEDLEVMIGKSTGKFKMKIKVRWRRLDKF